MVYTFTYLYAIFLQASPIQLRLVEMEVCVKKTKYIFNNYPPEVEVTSRGYLPSSGAARLNIQRLSPTLRGIIALVFAQSVNRYGEFQF